MSKHANLVQQSAAPKVHASIRHYHARTAVQYTQWQELFQYSPSNALKKAVLHSLHSAFASHVPVCGASIALSSENDLQWRSLLSTFPSLFMSQGQRKLRATALYTIIFRRHDSWYYLPAPDCQRSPFFGWVIPGIKRDIECAVSVVKCAVYQLAHVESVEHARVHSHHCCYCVIHHSLFR